MQIFLDHEHAVIVRLSQAEARALAEALWSDGLPWGGTPWLVEDLRRALQQVVQEEGP